MKKVEQITINGVKLGFDKKLKTTEIQDFLKEDLGKLKTNKNPYEIDINGVVVKLFVKQITYLGHPHPIFKKRIQISKSWCDELKEENAFLIGIYQYKNTRIYGFFDKTNFIQRQVNNSSAHISTFDLLNAQIQGVFTKKDIRGNIISAVRNDQFLDFLTAKINHTDTSDKEIVLFENFKNSLDKNYHGIACYSEMIKQDYHNKFQPEWAGFFLEFKFEEFLEKNPNYKQICQYQSNKKDSEIDLDLNFNNQFLGDLKAHTNGTGGILGNDKINVDKALSLYEKFWYIVFNHNTEKDSDYKNEVAIYWNTRQGKENLLSYAKKMKNNISFTDFKILEINTYNQKYLSIFNQGVNSNGKPREPKIKINKRDINNFLIYSSNF